MKYLLFFIFCSISSVNYAYVKPTESHIDTILTKYKGDTLLKNSDPTVEVMPEYPGGINAFYAYVEENINWPQELYHQIYLNGHKGPMLATFVIEKDGRVADIDIKNDLGFGTGEELVRVLKNCPKWTPGVQNK